jgi:hypothetical protein
VTKECRDLCKEVDTAIKMISHNGDRKILSSEEVEELYFMLLDRFVTLLRAYRYGFLNMKLPESAREMTQGSSGSSKADKKNKGVSTTIDLDDLDDLDEDEEMVDRGVLALKEELGKCLDEVVNLEQQLQRKDITDETKQKLEHRIDKKRAHMQGLKADIKIKEEEDRKLEEEMRQRAHDQVRII